MDNRIESPLMTPPDRIDAARARRDRLPEARRGAARPPRQRAGRRDVRPRVPRVHAPLGVQASRRRATSSAPSRTCGGTDLAWYWRIFWYATDVLDLGIDGVTMRSGAGRSSRRSRIAPQRRSVPFPIDVRAALADGIHARRALPGRRVGAPERPGPHRACGRGAGGRHRCAAVAATGVVARLERDERHWGDAPAADPSSR